MRKIIIAALISVLIITVAALAEADRKFVCAVTKGEWVWLRATPDENGEKIGTIRYGVEGEIHEIQGLYARITTSDGREGWAHVAYLLMPIREEMWRVNSDGYLNRRETPNGRMMGNIKPGIRISVLGWRYDHNGELWAKVYKGGYVKAKYLAKE